MTFPSIRQTELGVRFEMANQFDGADGLCGIDCSREECRTSVLFDALADRCAKARLERLERNLSHVLAPQESQIGASVSPQAAEETAKRIVGDRTVRGLFRGPGDLDRVPGVGQALLATLQGRVSYRGVAAEVPTPSDDANLSRLRGYAPPAVHGAGGPIDLNSAAEADLLALPGIGPARARAILAYRRDKGSFAAVSDLGRVSGFGRALVARLTPFLMAR